MQLPTPDNGNSALREQSASMLSSPCSIESLLDKASELFSECEYEMAARFYQRVLELEPNNLAAIDGYGALLLEVGELDSARDIFIMSVRLAPNSGAEKYLNLAQLINGFDSINCYRKAIELLISERAVVVVEEGDASEAVKDLNQQIVAAYCALVEIYLTDACFEANAEEECQRLLDEASKYDKESCEVLQTLANLRMSQCRNEEALSALQKSYEIWSSIEDVTKRPSFDFRTTTAKLYLELEQWEKAQTILDELVEEHDGVAELWWLLYLAHTHRQSSTSSTAIQCLLKAKNLLDKIDLEEASGFKDAVYAAWDDERKSKHSSKMDDQDE